MNKFIFAMMMLILMKCEFSSYEDACKLPGWNIIRAFDSGKSKGSGAFGQVNTVVLPNGGSAVVKRIPFGGFDVNEINCLITLSGSQNIPKFYGCQYNSEYVYIALTNIEYSLNDSTWLNSFRNWKRSEQINAFAHMVFGLQYMWKKGLVHNDLKTDNMMADHNKNLYLIDFGLATSRFKPTPCRAHIIFQAPSKYQNPNEANNPWPLPRDDLYSVALAIAEMFSPQGRNYVFTDWAYQIGGGHIPDRGSYRPRPEYRQVYATNAAYLLSKAGFGQYNPNIHTVYHPEINFTTMISIMILFIDNSIQYDSLLTVIHMLFKAEVKKENPPIQNHSPIQYGTPTQYGTPIQNRSPIQNNLPTKNNFPNQSSLSSNVQMQTKSLPINIQMQANFLSMEDKAAWVRYFAFKGFKFVDNEPTTETFTVEQRRAFSAEEMAKYKKTKEYFLGLLGGFTAQHILNDEEKMGHRYGDRLIRNNRNLQDKNERIII